MSSLPQLQYYYYIFNDMINIKNFDPNLLNINKISFDNTDAVICNIKYITMKSLDHENIDSENVLYIIFNNVDGYIIDGDSIKCNSNKCSFIEESNGDKSLILASTNKNKKVLKNTQ